jgi:hypothetical protein
MAEDSGAFKTNQANSRQIPAFYHDLGAAWQRCRTARINAFPAPAGSHAADIYQTLRDRCGILKPA